MKRKAVSLVLTGVILMGGSMATYASTNPVAIETVSSRVAAWQPNTSYQVGEQVVFENGLYECKVAHSRLKPTVAYVWAYKGTYQEIPNWTKGKKYVVGDQVYYKGHVYECIVDHVRLSPTMRYVWRMLP